MSIEYHNCPHKIEDVDSNHIPVNIDLYQIDKDCCITEEDLGKWMLTCDFLVPVETSEKRYVTYALFLTADIKGDLTAFFEKTKVLYACALNLVNQVTDGTIRGFEEWK